MDDKNIFNKIAELSTFPSNENNPSSERNKKIAEHKAWLKTIQKEYPNTNSPAKVAIYIRYFNQTKYDNYIEYHKKEFINLLKNCPKWELIGIYIDEGAYAPKMEKAKEWRRLLDDCQKGKVDLIITQKVANVSSDMFELTLLARYFATLSHPIGMYFISEDIFTLASYYQEDLKDTSFLIPEKQYKTT